MMWLGTERKEYLNMTDDESGDESCRNNDERPEEAAGPLSQDPTLLALENLVEAAQQVARMTERVTARAAYIRACRLQGRPYREIIDREEVPLIAGLLAKDIRRLEAASTRFRQAEAAALHQEGMTMEEIARLFGLTRQRISAMIRGAAAAPPSPTGHDDASPPPTDRSEDDPRESDSPSP
jgi:hypothetical protein